MKDCIFESQEFITDLLRAEMELNDKIDMNILNQLVEQDEERRKVAIKDRRIYQLTKKKDLSSEEVRELFEYYQEKEKEYQRQVRDIHIILSDIKKRKAHYAVMGLENGFPQDIECAGIYCIKIDGRIVYIGQSKNIRERLVQHCKEIVSAPVTLEGNKYELLHAIVDAGWNIDFEVLERGEDLDKMESKWIRRVMPILNTQVPIVGDSRIKIQRNEKKIGTVNEFICWLEKGRDEERMRIRQEELKEKEEKKKRNIEHIKDVFGEEGCVF